MKRGTEKRRTEPPPSFVTDEVLRIAGDMLDHQGMHLAKTMPNSKKHYEFNQLAHWLWRLAGVEPSDLEPENERRIRFGPLKLRRSLGRMPRKEKK